MERNICPADVISLFESDGKIRPLRIRFQDEEQVYRRMDIDQIIRRDEIRYIGAEAQIFFCKVISDDQRWLIKLKYSLRNHNWSILWRQIA